MKIDKEQLFNALGLEQDGATSWFAPALVGFGVGAIVGGALALLFAPKAGADLREDIVERGRKIVEKGKGQFADYTSKNPSPTV